MNPETKFFHLKSKINKIKGISFDGEFINKLRPLNMTELINLDEVLLLAKIYGINIRKEF